MKILLFLSILATFKKDIVEIERFPQIGDDAMPKGNLSKVFIDTNNTHDPPQVERTVLNSTTNNMDYAKDYSSLTADEVQQSSPSGSASNINTQQNSVVSANVISEKSTSAINEIISTNNIGNPFVKIILITS